ncbi:MAG: penicillin-insensitive murein endopeptidase [Myxococcales bacterium]|nr:penicillin-insensitive murein endopeptidase [Polyangiaceae bacterium]MDW8248295.1 penicillin-insensitive murein endopeptidase [Myxococcales bacterium]
MRRSFPLWLLLLVQGCVPPSRQTALVPAPAPPPAASPEMVTHDATHSATPSPEVTPEVAAEPRTDEGPYPHDMEHEEEEVDDHEEESGVAARTKPKIELTDEEIARKARTDLASLGSLSVGTPNRGYLINGVQMPPGEHWQIIGAPSTWGTQETIDFITRAILSVNKQFPGSPRLFIGHISARHGGYLSPHKSHQAGRDVDLGYYYNREARWFERAHAQNIDLPRTWALVKAFIQDTDVEMIFIDTSIQHLLLRYAVETKEDPSFLDRVFQIRGKSPTPIVRHVKGHATHIHVRFHSPIAQEMARRAQAYLRRPADALTKAPPPTHGSGKGGPSAPLAPDTHYVMHKARSGDVLVNLAKHYGTTPEAIVQANQLKGHALKIGHIYRIPVPAKVPPAGKPPEKKAPLAPPHGKPSRG